MVFSGGLYLAHDSFDSIYFLYKVNSSTSTIFCNLFTDDSSVSDLLSDFHSYPVVFWIQVLEDTLRLVYPKEKSSTSLQIHVSPGF